MGEEEQQLTYVRVQVAKKSVYGGGLLGLAAQVGEEETSRRCGSELCTLLCSRQWSSKPYVAVVGILNGMASAGACPTASV